MSATNTGDDLVILDDGRYCVALNCNHDSSVAPGFLECRCYVGVTTPGGYECIGSFDREPDGSWSASIDVPYNFETDSDARKLGRFATRLDAIVALWGNRHDALCRHGI